MKPSGISFIFYFLNLSCGLKFQSLLLKFFNRNLFSCLHLVTNSDRLLSSSFGYWEVMIACFSWRRKEHLFVILEYVFAVRKTSHVRAGATFFLFFFFFMTWQEQNKDIFNLIWRCLCFAFVESLRCCMSARWIYSEYFYNDWSPYYSSIWRKSLYSQMFVDN